MDILDDFSTDTITDYTFDSGTGTLSVSGGQLVPSSTAVKRFYHSGRGYTYTDFQQTVKFTAAGTVGTGAISVGKRIDATNGIHALLDLAAGLSIYKEVAGVFTDLSGATAATVAASTTYWLRFRIEGNVVTAEHWAAEPTPMGTPTSTRTYTLSTSEAAAFGVTGTPLVRTNGVGTSYRYDDLRVEPFTYANRTLPEAFQLAGTIPGDATALADIAVTHSGGSAAPVFALLGWSPHPQTHNLVWNGGFEDGTSGWSVAAVAALSITAATSVAATSLPAPGAKYGTSVASVTTISGNANSGASFTIYRNFRKGVTYTYSLWVRSSASVANVTGIFGVTGDNTGSSATALSTSWQQISIAWTPTADVSSAQIGVRRTTSGAADVFQIDGVQVYDGTTAPTVGSHSEGKGAYPPFGVVEAEACDSTDLSNWAVTASGSYGGGYYLTHATASSATAGWWVDPNLLVPDDYTMGELNVEVWARVLVDSAAASPKYTLSVRPEAGLNYGSERFTLEYGSAGKLIAKPSSGTAARFIRLGTLPMIVDRREPRRWKLWLAYSHTGSAASGVDRLVLVPSRGRALSPSGKVNDSTYPRFMASTNETTRIIRSDLSGRTSKPPASPHPDTGLGGELIELPFGSVDGLVKLSSLSPDDPTSDTTTEQLGHAATIHYAVTPRWMMLRGSS